MTTTINTTTTTNNNVTMNAPASATSAVVNTTINTAAVTPNLKHPDLVDFTLDGAEAQYKAGEYDKLLAQCKQDAANTKWLEEGIRDIRFEASHDEPLCADEYAKQMKVSEEAVLDTQQNAGLNLTTCIGKKPVGDSAVRSICDRGMIGMNCYELLRKERRESLKEVLNLILAERKGAVQVKYSYDKVRAVHSARYAAIGNDKLLKIMPVTALDIYLAVCDAYAGVVRNHTQDAKKIFAAADCVARCARTRWSDVDMPGKEEL